MAAALLSSFYLWYKQQRRRKSVRVPYRMRTASFSVVRFFSLLLSTAWVGLVGYREIPIRTLHLNVHTHKHTHTHRYTHLQFGDTDDAVPTWSWHIAELFSFRSCCQWRLLVLFVQLLVLQINVNRVVLGVTVWWRVLQYIADQHKFVTSTQMIR